MRLSVPPPQRNRLRPFASFPHYERLVNCNKPMKKWLILRAGLSSACLASACGSSGPLNDDYSFLPESLSVLTSTSGRQRVEVRTAPDQPPTRGNVWMQLSVTDSMTGAPDVGLDVLAVPWMPAMGHGTSVKPTIVEASPGIYELRNLSLFMPGTWEIRTQFAGPATDHVTPTFDIR